jgi:hypothetical protein
MVYSLNPLEDHRWTEFVDRHPKASVFHGMGWLEALRRTYGYEPVAYSTTPPTSARLANGVVFCRVDSWLTGRRLVSLPFTDHCEPLVDDPADRANLVTALTQAVSDDSRSRRLKYIEIRSPRSDSWDPAAAKAGSFAFHCLDLEPPTAEIYARTHKSTIQRKIQRGTREGLCYESGNSEALLKKFYGLVLMTRRRHQLPPQPVQWFRNLAACMRNQLTIRVASKDGRPIAGILTLEYRDTMVYKYGCSNARYHNLGGMPFLFWKAIEEAKELGLRRFDLGRSDRNNTGLITFKERWGASPSDLTYVRYTAPRSQVTAGGFPPHALRRIFAWMPDRLLTTTGTLLYRHIG